MPTTPSRQQIENVIDELIRPVLHADGGDLRLERISDDGKTVFVYLTGRCAGCPGADFTIESLVTKFIKEKIPEIERVSTVNWHLPDPEAPDIEEGPLPAAKTQTDDSPAPD